MSTLSALSKMNRRSVSSSEDTEQEGWMVAYADLITLLFIFFSLILSISVISKTKFEMMANQINHQDQPSNLLSLKKELDAKIAQHELSREVSTYLGSEGLHIQFSEGILFATAEANLNANGKLVLGKFASTLTGIQNSYLLAVEGHTDTRPIQTSLFPNNWALSASRSVNVLNHLSDLGIDERRMRVRAFAATRPLETGNHAKNRRVTLLVY